MSGNHTFHIAKVAKLFWFSPTIPEMIIRRRRRRREIFTIPLRVAERNISLIGEISRRFIF
jgi:hypothetical protein